jgi:unsaturated rhamnogalacturonyl hydrolase
VRSNPSPYPKFEWMLAPLFAGVYEYSQYRNEPEAANWLRAEGEANGYKMGPRPGMADDVAVGQAFIQLYLQDRKPEQIAPVQAWMDGWISKPHTASLEWKNGIHNSEMAWCDALFMAPPTMALLSKATGDPRYAAKMAELWWKTSDYLYDPSEQLYFRDSRYFEPREANGKKVFWSRGNGWVLAGLARVLMHLPANFEGRAKLEKQFKEMASRIAKLQTPDGTWHASLLDPESFPNEETSGTAFFVYSMAWGVNSGLLPRDEFESSITKGFGALCKAVDLNGRLGWVQPIGQDPKKVKNSDTDAYGVGGFLLAAGEMSQFLRRS